MREILPGIFTWGATYADKPWDLNGYALRLASGTVLIDPPGPEGDDWSLFDGLAPIEKIILTNRDHVRETELFRPRYGARVAAGAQEIEPLAPLQVDEPVEEGALVAGALRAIHLPGKSPGEIGLLLDPAHSEISRDLGGILFLGDAIIGHPPGELGLIPAQKQDDPARLKQSLRKLLDYDFEVLLTCDGLPIPHGAKSRVAQFLNDLSAG